MCWFELGEIAACILSPLAPLDRLWKCQCETRRNWLNEQGERLWAYWQPVAYDDFLAGFEDVALTQCRIGLRPATAIWRWLRVMGLGVSLRTTERWLDRMVKSGDLAVLVMSDVKQYGLPAKK